MPELPEVETMCRGIAVLRGQTVKMLSFPVRRGQRPIPCSPAARTIEGRLEAARLVDVRRRGKRAVLEFAAGSDPTPAFLVIEPRMTGLLLVADPPTADHVRVRVRFRAATAPDLLFWDRRGLGTVSLVDAAGLERLCGRERLGPDALGIDGESLRERLGRSRRPVKAALLDQKAVAGIGNIYASEILFRAKVHPARRCRRLARAAWNRIADSARSILSEAIAAGGSTLGDATYRTAENRPGGYQSRHCVYARAGRPCPECAATIRREVLAQRSTFWCPSCQSARGGR